MELKIIAKRDDFIELEVVGEDPSILDSLAEILQGIDGVEYAGAVIEHPLTMKNILRVKTNIEKINAKDALIKAVDELLNFVNMIYEKINQI
ncbi:MAG: RpoL/Rpb11 RNA polymerase subunit family protein [Candidatus Caldarchaeales archaeon]